MLIKKFSNLHSYAHTVLRSSSYFIRLPQLVGLLFLGGGAECVLRHFSINWGFQKEVLLDYGIKNPFYIKQFLSSLVF